VRCFQADNCTEFLNNATATFLVGRGILLRTSHIRLKRQS
jgi:hypothetical protein